MTLLFPSLKRSEQRGSKPRCHLLTEGLPADVAARLMALSEPWATVSPSDRWMPLGFQDTAEAQLHRAETLLDTPIREALLNWWLAAGGRGARTPNWDIAATCTIEGRRGLLLVEAKAHHDELIHAEAGRTSLGAPVTPDARRNLLRIEWALRDASIALEEQTGLVWALSRDFHYQMANRFAWAWKIASLGVPVVLVYLGFLGAQDMAKGTERPLADPEEWGSLVRAHSKPLFPGEIWNTEWRVDGVPLVPLIRSLRVDLPGMTSE